jgi:hypothetical protein
MDIRSHIHSHSPNHRIHIPTHINTPHTHTNIRIIIHLTLTHTRSLTHIIMLFIPPPRICQPHKEDIIILMCITITTLPLHLLGVLARLVRGRDYGRRKEGRGNERETAKGSRIAKGRGRGKEIG